MTLALLGPNDFFGEISLLDGEPWYADAKALDDCQLLLLAQRDLLTVLDRHPGVSRQLLTIICKRLRHNGKFAHDLAFLDIPTRVARTLVTLVESTGWGWDGYPQESLPLEITQSDLAAHVGATRESVNKWLGYYKRRGYIHCTRDSITILQLDELRSRAGAE